VILFRATTMTMMNIVMRTGAARMTTVVMRATATMATASARTTTPSTATHRKTSLAQEYRVVFLFQVYTLAFQCFQNKLDNLEH